MNGWTPAGVPVQLTDRQAAWVDYLLAPEGRRLAVLHVGRANGWATALHTAARVDRHRRLSAAVDPDAVVDIVTVGPGAYVAGFVAADGWWHGCDHRPTGGHDSRQAALRCAETRLAFHLDTGVGCRCPDPLRAVDPGCPVHGIDATLAEGRSG